MKDLLIYLNKGILCHKDDIGVLTLYGYNGCDMEPYMLFCNETGKVYKSYLHAFKPFLYPIDMIDEEIVVIGFNDDKPFVPLLKLIENDILTFYTDISLVDITDKYINFSYYDDFSKTAIYDTISLDYNTVNTLASWHIDIFNLINDNRAFDKKIANII